MALMWLWVIYTALFISGNNDLAHKYVNYTFGSFLSDIFPCLAISLAIMAVSSLYYLAFQNQLLLLGFYFRNVWIALYWYGSILAIRDME